MEKPITNQASLEYKSGDNVRNIKSNIATVTLKDIINIDKTSLEGAYRIGETVVYNVLFQNTSSGNLSNVTLVDDLGTYNSPAGNPLTPLTYEGPAKEYRNGISMGEITPEIKDHSITFKLANVAPHSRVMLQYKVRVNEFSPAAKYNNKIKNTVRATINVTNEEYVDFNEIPLDSYTDVSIDKEMAPDPISPGDRLLYKFVITNSGTKDATNVFLKDTFNPIPTDLRVYVDNELTNDYSFNPANGEFVYPNMSNPSAVNLEKAHIMQDSTTGLVTINPTKFTVKISGKIS